MSPKRWLEAGRTGPSLWGRFAGSAAQPYQTVVVTGEPGGSVCTCPSRQHPCKHARELGGLGVAHALAEAELPDFARPWVTRLTTRSERPRAPARTEPADPVAAAQRAAVRRARVSEGLAELERWLADQVRGGLAELPRAGYGHVDRVAARMVDAQAPGVAGALRSLPGDLVGEGWPERGLHALAALHLLARAHRQLDELPAGLAATVRSRVGYPQAKAEVLAGPAVPDTWWALGAVDTVEYQLTTRRVWLYGTTTARFAVWLTFAPPGQDLDDSVQPGRPLVADLHFYPGAGHRALVGEPHEGDPEPLLTVGHRLTAVREQFAALLAEDPWASRMPAVVLGTPRPPDHRGEDWLLCDADALACRLTGLSGEPWPLVAQAGARPLLVFGEWDGAALTPLSVLPDDAGRVFSTAVVG